MEYTLSFSLYRAASNCLPGQDNIGPYKAQIAWRRQLDKNVPAVQLNTNMHVKQMSTAAHPEECTAEHSTQHCRDTQSSSTTLYTQGDLTLHKHTQWKTAAVNTDSILSCATGQ